MNTRTWNWLPRTVYTWYIHSVCVVDTFPVPLLGCNVAGRTRVTPWVCTAEFSESVIGFVAADILVVGGTLSGDLARDPSICDHVCAGFNQPNTVGNVPVYTFTVTPANAELTVSITIPGNVCTVTFRNSSWEQGGDHTC